MPNQEHTSQDQLTTIHHNDDTNEVEVTHGLLDLGGRGSLQDVLEQDNLSAIEAADNSSDQEELLSVDEATVSRLMREQDAELLESMHYASSQVSNYSPGGTPQIRPADNTLPPEVDDLPMLSEAALPITEASTMINTTDDDFGKTLVDEEVDPNSIHNTARHPKAPLSRAGGTVSDDVSTSTLLSNKGDNKDDDGNGNNIKHGELVSDSLQPISTSEQQQRRFRRCLSGELRAIPPEASDDPRSHSIVVDEEDIPTSSDKSTSQILEVQETSDPTTTTDKSPALEQQQDAETDDRAKQRRMNEAMQFAEAVGEMIPIRQDELRIIEDNSEGDESDDDSDNEDGSVEAKEINVLEELKESTDAAATLPDTINESNHQAVSKVQPLDVQPLQLPPPVPPREHTIPPSQSDIVRHTSDQGQNRRKSRPQWPFGPAGKEPRFVDKLSDGFDKSDFVYKGIQANPPEITTRGIQRGNYAQLHRKAWLEVSDKYHRYGKNLRLYYRHWESIGYPTNEFFDWLDSKGEAAGQPLPNLEECPRSVLDADTVLYIVNPEVTDGYFLDIIPMDDGRGKVIDVDGDPVQTGPDGWIFVLRDGKMYGAQKVTSITGHSKQRFHHSSFFGGKAVASAGIVITDDDGYLDRLYPHSGHYRPGESHMQRMLYFVHKKGVDLRTFKVDTQQFRRVARDKESKKDKDGKKGEKEKDGEKGDKEKEEKKVKKVDSLHLEKAVNVACFLAHKAGFIGHGVFNSIHKIRKADVTSVTEALESVDDGGFWPKQREPELEDRKSTE